MRLFHAPKFTTFSLAVIILCTTLMFMFGINHVVQRTNQIHQKVLYEIHPEAKDLFKHIQTTTSKI